MNVGRAASDNGGWWASGGDVGDGLWDWGNLLVISC